ncbi:hypothetical protein FIBSPDRAFT_420014 [Athelia psychrophila]|uniref:Transmembrane protein n=1 Tax=Athelia psychrophila TaxID=1759441 RepID=A0A166N6Q2_9AGAM|nr:hypothetical protein FIBSPDRAFT_420014 [Fibularhizoctonia sp. CBS 109695]
MPMRSIPPGSSQLKCLTFLLLLSFIPLTVASLESTTFGVPRAHMEKRRAPNHARELSLIPELLPTSSHASISLSSATPLPSSTAPATSSSSSATLPISTPLPSSSSAPASSAFTSSSSTPGFPVPTSLSSSTAPLSLPSSSVASITIPVPSSASSVSLSSSSLSSFSSLVSVVGVPLQLTSFSTTSALPVITTVTASSSSTPRVVPVATPTGGVSGNVSKSGFFANTGAVAGTFTAVGVVALALLITLIYCCKKRQNDEDDYDTYFEKVTPKPNPAATVPVHPAQNMFAPTIYPDPPSNPFVEDAYIQDAYAGQSNAYAGPSRAPGQQQQYNDYHLEQPDMYQPESAYQPAQAQARYPTARPPRPTSGGELTTQEHLAALQRRRSSRGPPQPEINPFGSHAVVRNPSPYGGDADSFYGAV